MLMSVTDTQEMLKIVIINNMALLIVSFLFDITSIN